MPGWPHSRFYKWFGQYNENVLCPFFIRNYSKEKIILEDEYQAALNVKFDDDEPELDLAERVVVITRTASDTRDTRFMSIVERSRSIK